MGVRRAMEIVLAEAHKGDGCIYTLGPLIHNNQVLELLESKGITSVEDISDGTIQTLAMLVAYVDPRNTLLLIEEVENSVHPWIIKILIKKFRKISVSKPVIITTHSPVLIDLIYPNEIWLVFKQKGETHLKKLVNVDKEIASDWEKGKIKLYMNFLEIIGMEIQNYMIIKKRMFVLKKHLEKYINIHIKGLAI